MERNPCRPSLVLVVVIDMPIEIPGQREVLQDLKAFKYFAKAQNIEHRAEEAWLQAVENALAVFFDTLVAHPLSNIRLLNS
jgi:hypothetical protein